MKKLLITGISSDISKSIINTFKDEYKIIGIYHTSLDLNIDNIDLYKCDVTNEEEVKELVNLLKEKYGTIDLLINAHSKENDEYILDKTGDSFNEVLSTIITGTFLMMKYSIKYLNVSYIVNISSTDSIDTYNEYNLDYSVSKAGLNMMTKIFSEIFPSINFKLILLNYVDTYTTRLMNPEYLKSELNRIGQKELIKPDFIADKLKNIVDSNNNNLIVRIDNND